MIVQARAALMIFLIFLFIVFISFQNNILPLYAAINVFAEDA